MDGAAAGELPLLHPIAELTRSDRVYAVDIDAHGEYVRARARARAAGAESAAAKIARAPQTRYFCPHAERCGACRSATPLSCG